MNIGKIFSSIAICASSAMLPLAIIASDASLSVVISTEKSVYVSGEPIKITAHLHNRGSRDVAFLPDPGYRLFNLTITDAQGTVIIPHRVNHIGYGPGRSSELGADQDFSVDNDLSEWGYDLTPGKYSVVASFDQSFRGRKHAIAPMLTITILPKT